MKMSIWKFILLVFIIMCPPMILIPRESHWFGTGLVFAGQAIAFIMVRDDLPSMSLDIVEHFKKCWEAAKQESFERKVKAFQRIVNEAKRRY